MSTAVAIISDIRLYRQGLELVLERDGRAKVVGTAAARAGALELIRRASPHVVLLDMAMQDAMDSVRSVTQAFPAVGVVALAVEETEAEVIACAEAGVVGYVTREGTVDDVIESVEAAGRAELRCSPRVAAYLLQRVKTLSERPLPNPNLEQLTARQRKVLQLISDGLSNKEIALALHIELTTVKNHVHNILEKLQVQRRGEATALWRQDARAGSLPYAVSR